MNYELKLKHTLFVCQSCHRSSEDRPKDQPADGDRLLEQLNTLGTEHIKSNKFQSQPVGYLWPCDKPCATAFSAPHKPTYLFTRLPPIRPLPPFCNLAIAISNDLIMIEICFVIECY